MPRIVSVWLPRWPILRFLHAQTRQPCSEPVDPRLPFALAAAVAGVPSIAALNAAAEAEGLAAGEPLADARAKAHRLQVRAADPSADRDALARLAGWATRYTPSVSPWEKANGTDGLFLDVTGAAHLLGGETGLLRDLSRRLGDFGLPSRVAIADTPGAAWALARFSASSLAEVPSGTQAQRLAPLPVEALRLSTETCVTLRRLGFKRIGALIGTPRAPFAARFETELLTRLDQSLGRVPEPLVPFQPPPAYRAFRRLLEPIATQEAIVEGARRLMQELSLTLMEHGKGAKELKLTLYRVDGAAETVDIGLAMPTLDPSHVAYLIRLKLERPAEALDAGFGFEALSLAVTTAEPLDPKQHELSPHSAGHDSRERSAALLDALEHRLGSGSVHRLVPHASHIPERSEHSSPGAERAQPWPEPDGSRLRPILLLPRAEPAEVIALAPDGPPERFLWRGTAHRIVCADGPERIASEWWRTRAPRPTRDYFVVENGAGRRFWLYREGVPGRETTAPRWFVHGLFA